MFNFKTIKQTEDEIVLEAANGGFATIVAENVTRHKASLSMTRMTELREELLVEGDDKTSMRNILLADIAGLEKDLCFAMLLQKAALQTSKKAGLLLLNDVLATYAAINGQPAAASVRREMTDSKLVTFLLQSID